MFLFSLKNMWRYRSRSLLTLIVIAISAFVTVFTIGIIEGMLNHMINGFVQYDTAHIKINTTEFVQKERFKPLYAGVPEIDKLSTELLAMPNVKQVIPTFKFSAMILTKEESLLPVQVIAFNLLDNTFNLQKRIVDGTIQRNGIVIGEKLQQKLNDTIGNTPTLLSSTVYSSLNATQPPITAITKFGIKKLDEHTVFMDISIAKQLLRSPNSTDVFIVLDDINKTDSLVTILQQKYPQLSIRSYKKQLGILYYGLEIEKRILHFIGMIIMFFGSFIIVNSIISGIYERMPEIGMLKAVGFTNKELVQTLVWEGIIYGIVGGSLGCVFGYLAIQYLSNVGINISAMLGSADLLIDSVIYPQITLITTILAYLVVVIIPALVALIPAKIIKNISPVDALSFHY